MKADRNNTPGIWTRVTRSIVGRVSRWRSGVLVISGLGSLVAAAWVMHLVAGLAALGLALLLLDLVTRRDDG
jgi:hypothetical protein